MHAVSMKWPGSQDAVAQSWHDPLESLPGTNCMGFASDPALVVPQVRQSSLEGPWQVPPSPQCSLHDWH